MFCIFLYVYWLLVLLLLICKGPWAYFLRYINACYYFKPNNTQIQLILSWKPHYTQVMAAVSKLRTDWRPLNLQFMTSPNQYLDSNHTRMYLYFIYLFSSLTFWRALGILVDRLILSFKWQTSDTVETKIKQTEMKTKHLCSFCSGLW